MLNMPRLTDSLKSDFNFCNLRGATTTCNDPVPNKSYNGLARKIAQDYLSIEPAMQEAAQNPQGLFKAIRDEIIQSEQSLRRDNGDTSNKPNMLHYARLVDYHVSQNIRFNDDIKIFSKPDHWAAPHKTLGAQGDCEDFAIAKMSLLMSLGFPPDKMWVTLATQTQTTGTINHAVLLIEDPSGQKYVLDNLKDSFTKLNTLDAAVNNGLQPYALVNSQGVLLQDITNLTRTLSAARQQPAPSSP